MIDEERRSGRAIDVRRTKARVVAAYAEIFPAAADYGEQLEREINAYLEALGQP